jgi:hypothetical protein
MCDAPDRDVPGIRCGYPMPCPHHTADGGRKIRVGVVVAPDVPPPRPPTAPANLSKPVWRLHHAALRRTGESLFRSACPACGKGMLLVRREPVTFRLARFDVCVACGQRVEYLDSKIGGEEPVAVVEEGPIAGTRLPPGAWSAADERPAKPRPQAAPGDTKLGWEYCECGCKGVALKIGGLDFWLYDTLQGGKDCLYLGLGHGYALSKRVGTFDNYDDAEKAVRAKVDLPAIEAALRGEPYDDDRKAE